MAQLFGPQANWLARATLLGTPILVVLVFIVAGAVDESSYVTDEGHYIEQPVPFSHQHHVDEIGIDCRYCHTQVERSASATLPPAELCMTCHSQIWNKAPILQPVRESAESKQPLRWQRVTKLPDFVYFNHSIHVQKGISCISCHGEMGRQPLTKLVHPMTMEFCLDCHQSPEKNLVPPDEIFAGFKSSRSIREQEEKREQLSHHYGVSSKMDCITCHR